MDQASLTDTLNAAIGHYNAGRIGEAESLCDRLRAVTANPLVVRLAGLCAERRGDLTAAIRLLAAGADADGATGDLFRALMALGGERLTRLEFAGAQTAFERALSLSPADFSAMNNLGVSHRRRGGRDAFLCYERALAAEPEAMRDHAHLKMAALRRRILDQAGPTVLSGPFAGMRYDGGCAEGWYLPRMVGCYEQELHDEVLAAAARGYDCVINIGCAEGYYAVGLARLMPQATVHAHDLNPNAQIACRRLADENGVGDRVRVGGMFDGEMFAAVARGRTLLVCDIEGAEEELLDPQRFPALRGVDVLVELHDCYRPGLSAVIADRFAASHDVRIIANGAQRHIPMPPVLAGMSQEELGLTIGEFRAGPTPWGVMQTRKPAEA
jgi:hypothetical protein